MKLKLMKSIAQKEGEGMSELKCSVDQDDLERNMKYNT